MSKAQELDRAQELRKNIDTMDACVAAGKNWPFVISTGAIRHVLDELDAARAALTASIEQQAAQQGADTIALPRKEWEELQYYLDRCYDKGHLDQCFDLVEPLEALNLAIAARASNGGKA